MVRTDKFSVEQIQAKIIETCEKLYGPMDHDSYFIVPNTTENAVRADILDNIDDRDIAKMKYLDIAAYVLQTGTDVFIKII